MQDVEKGTIDGGGKAVAAKSSSGGGQLRKLFQPSFLICLLILGAAAGGMSVAVKTFGVYLRNEPLAIRKSLDLLDEDGFGNYIINSKTKIENHAIVESLGTEEYIKWIIEDPDVEEASEVRKCLLFITYYDLPDRVPHVPEECYAGGGNQRKLSESVKVKIPTESGFDEIPCKYLVFASTKSDAFGSYREFPVMYVFSVNGVYANSRNAARTILNKNIFGKYSYFCKVEWNFYNNKFGSQVYPDKALAVSASEKLLSVLLPKLKSEYLPVFKDGNVVLEDKE